MLDLSFLSTPTGVVLAVTACVAGSVAVMAVRAHLSSKRKTWASLGQKCSLLQLPHFASIFSDLAVNDISGAIRAGEDLKSVLLDDSKRKPALMSAGKAIVTDLYQDPVYKADIDAFIKQLQSANLPSKASTFASAVDELANQKTLLQDMQTTLQTGLNKAGTDLAALNSKVKSDVSNLAGSVGAGAAAGAPGGVPGAAAGAGAAVVHLVLHPADSAPALPAAADKATPA